ncbi:uncharacterized protein LOC134136684 [Rhea pennata]|uniref:uncharacterized protein LOC134136684 n=1 Tax=Rhea pennata TaxID=8795 RepID=UPI002E26A7B9
MDNADDVVEMPALGRPFQLGMLYDCRKDILVPGISLWDLDTIQKNADAKPQCRSEFKIITSDSMEDKASALGIEASLQVSLLCGMANVSGSAEYLRDNKSSRRQARVTLQYLTTTQFKQLMMNQLGRQNLSCPDVFDQGTATHMVTAVLYGAQAFFVFDREVSENENVQEIQGRLELVIAKKLQVKPDGKGSGKMDEKDKSFTEKFSCQFYSDFALKSNPVTYEDAMQVYAALPEMLGANGEKAVPVKVWLYPLTKLDSKAARLVREISLALVFNAQDALERLAELDMCCNDMLIDPVATSFPEIKRKLQQFKDLCKQHRLAFQKELAAILPSIRGGEKEERLLNDILTCYQQSPFNIRQLKEFLDKKEQEMTFLKSHLSLLKDVPVVSSQNQLDKIVLDPMNQFVISFTFTSLHEEEPYLSSLKLWLQPKSTANTQDLASASSKTKAKVWFEDKAVKQRARKAAKALSDFARVNKSSEKIRFVTSSILDKTNPGASIYLYEDGELVSTDFEPPPKPPCPTAGKIKHDSVQLTFKPYNYRKAAVIRYWVEYRLAGQESWIGRETTDTQGTFTVTGLHANTEYQFRYAAVSRLGWSMSSDSTNTVKTLPTSPPTQLVPTATHSSAITLFWKAPAVVGRGAYIREYRVEYKEEAGDPSHRGEGKWKEQPTGKKVESFTVRGLKRLTLYSFRVSALCADAAGSDPSEEVSSTTAAKGSEALSQVFLKKSSLVENGQPAVYTLPLEKVEKSSECPYLKYVLGAENLLAPTKVIMVVGATGSGKTTLINGMINYILGVQWEDNFRFKLIHETTNRSQAESQTSEVTAYEVNFRKGFRVPYNLTLIDTPGFGDTRGIEHDKLITQQIRDAFSAPGGTDKIDTICIVVQASLARLTHTQKYVFDSVLSIFGKDVRDNIQILVTFADGQTPPVLEAIKTAEVPYAKDAKGNPVHFKFNNSSLFVCSAGADDSSSHFDAMFWEMGAISMQKFFQSLSNMESRSLKLTKEVLQERRQLEVAVEGLQPQIEVALKKLEELRKTQEALVHHKDEMEANKDFEYEVDKVIPVQKIISGTGQYTTNCQNCHCTCHYPCTIPDDSHKYACIAIDKTSLRCTVCPGQCRWNTHFNQKYTFEYETVKEKQTYTQLKEQYEKAHGKMLSSKNLSEKLQQEYEDVKKSLLGLITRSSKSLQRLQKIALKPNPLSTPEYIDLLIKSEERELKPGYMDRIESLKDIRQHAEIIQKIANKEDLLPGEKAVFENTETQHSLKK